MGTAIYRELEHRRSLRESDRFQVRARVRARNGVRRVTAVVTDAESDQLGTLRLRQAPGRRFYQGRLVVNGLNPLPSQVTIEITALDRVGDSSAERIELTVQNPRTHPSEALKVSVALMPTGSAPKS